MAISEKVEAPIIERDGVEFVDPEAYNAIAAKLEELVGHGIEGITIEVGRASDRMMLACRLDPSELPGYRVSDEDFRAGVFQVRMRLRWIPASTRISRQVGSVPVPGRKDRWMLDEKPMIAKATVRIDWWDIEHICGGVENAARWVRTKLAESLVDLILSDA